MTTILKQSDFEDFWIRVYLNPKEDFFTACADRAYRDLNRTIHGLAKIQTKDNYLRIRAILIKISKELIDLDFKDQHSFDKAHRAKCYQLIESFKAEYDTVEYTIGQAQKWINMFLKYLFALGESRVSGISKNYGYFHVPLDNIIQDLFLDKARIKRVPVSWSRIVDYEIYLDYQKEIRKFYKKSIPLDVEFKLFNGDDIV